MTPTLTTLARVAYACLYIGDDSAWAIDPAAPDWVGKAGTSESGGLFSRAHGDFQPVDDVRMGMVASVLSAIANGDPPAAPELSLPELCAWLASHPLREGYADTAVFDDGHNGVQALLQQAYAIEFHDVAQSVLACLEAHLASLRGQSATDPVPE